MANDHIGSMMSNVMILTVVILAISYWEMHKDGVNDGSIIGSGFDLLKPLMTSSSYNWSMENAVIGLCIAFVLGAIVIGVASNSTQRNDFGVWTFIVRVVVVLFATTIWGLALNAMGYLLLLYHIGSCS